jgi:hypothetical protein
MEAPRKPGRYAQDYKPSNNQSPSGGSTSQSKRTSKGKDKVENDEEESLTSSVIIEIRQNDGQIPGRGEATELTTLIPNRGHPNDATTDERKAADRVNVDVKALAKELGPKLSSYMCADEIGFDLKIRESNEEPDEESPSQSQSLSLRELQYKVYEAHTEYIEAEVLGNADTMSEAANQATLWEQAHLKALSAFADQICRIEAERRGTTTNKDQKVSLVGIVVAVMILLVAGAGSRGDTHHLHPERTGLEQDCHSSVVAGGGVDSARLFVAPHRPGNSQLLLAHAGRPRRHLCPREARGEIGDRGETLPRALSQKVRSSPLRCSDQPQGEGREAPGRIGR